jgi:transcriptional repressor NrdR
MKCPYCGYFDTKVNDSRPTDDDTRIRRRRECLKCGRRFTTYEMVERAPVMVIKKDGSRELFDRIKLLNGLAKACEKRRISAETLDAAVDSIERSISNTMEREVTSEQIGLLAMEELKNIDDVAYVRFASVYREFKDINTFMTEIKDMLTSKD